MRRAGWLAGAVGFSLLFAWRTMAPGFRAGEWIQDDARQHVFWMLRFRDPELFPNDLMADYFRSIAPPGYAALYWALSWVVDPLQASKLIPFVLAALCGLFVFLLVARLYPWTPAAFLATVLASWYVWQYDDLGSASPRAFVLPCVTAVLWALAARRWSLAVLFTVLGALLYPIAAALSLALMAIQLVQLKGWRPWLVRDRAALLHLGLAVALVALVMLPEHLGQSPYGPTVTWEQARRMPEFGPDGRTFFFLKDPLRFWLEGYRSGLNLRVHDSVFKKIPILLEYAALALVLVPIVAARRRLPAARELGPATAVVARLLVVSFGLFFLAHALLFQLYLPTRYVQWTLPLALAIAAGLALAVIVQETARRAWSARSAPLAAALTVLLAVAVAVYPADYDGLMVRDHHPSLTRYLRALPKDVLIAAPAVEADSIPAFAGRSVVAAREHANPYHLGYYRELRQRLDDLIEAYYAPSREQVLTFADRYGVDYFVVKRAAFNRESYEDAWTDQFEPFHSRIDDKLKRPGEFALQQAARRCAILSDGEVSLISTSCLRAGR